MSSRHVLIVLTITLPVAVACSTAKDVQCLGTSSCDLASGGQCVASTDGTRWCAYPDSSCPAGFRYSDFDVRDDLGGTCVPELAPLTVEKAGFGAGTVVGTIASETVIDCGTGEGCTASLTGGTSITLTATALAGDRFFGWSGGGCSGTAPCVTSVTAATTVVATFDQCDRTSVDTCDETANAYERCTPEGQATMVLACPMYCSALAGKCVDLDPSDNPSTSPLNAQMDVLAGTGQELTFPSSCTPATCTINTDNGVITGATSGGSAASTVVVGNGRVFRVETFSLQGIVRVVGGQPLVVLANGEITIRGVLDASAELRAPGPGAQGSSAACTGRPHSSANGVSGGGGGGGRATVGAAGGNGTSAAVGGSGGMIQDEPTLIPLQGGCFGGWVEENNLTPTTWWGGGGGAVQLVSRRSISLVGGGVIDVSGGGGESGDESYPTMILGGSGGGSGGSVLLEAPSVSLDGAGVVLSAKGGGGSASGPRGFNGADGGFAAGPAPGGVNPNGATGGTGGTEAAAPLPGQNAQGTLGTDGGGGGGAVGVCRINTRDGAVGQANGAAVRCVRASNTRYQERLLPQ